MYLRGSKWSMSRRRKRPNWFYIILLSLMVLAASYVTRYVVPDVEPIGVPSPTATRDPESFVTQANELFDQGKLLASIEAYQQAIVASHSDPSIYVSLARVQVWAGQYKQAQTSAEDALLLNPNNSMAHAVRAWALDFQGSYLEAEAGIKRALELDPNNGLAHAYYVEILIDSYTSGTGSFEGINVAIEESRVALALAPNTIEAHRARGYILEATGNYQEALTEYQAAIDINGNIADLHLALGRNYRALQLWDLAVEQYTAANALNPSDPTPDLLISRMYHTIREDAKAVQYAESAMNDNPADTNLHGNLGVMYYWNLDWPAAALELAYVVNGGITRDGARVEPINLTPDTRIAEYYYTYGLALARLGRCGDGLRVAQMVLDRVPSDEIAVANANEISNICRANLNVTEAPAPAAEDAEPALTETPAAGP
jgi:tetratricopeptide (TPR) repeat protein